MPLLDGKKAIITGGARGIGKAIAERFLDEGASVFICDILEDRLDETARELRERGKVDVLSGDISLKHFCEEVATTARERMGEINVLVNNAGIARWGSILEHTEEDWDRTLAVNLKAVFLLSQQVTRIMVEQGKGGVILSMASNNGHVAEPSLSAYNAAKAGVVLLTQTMAIDLGEYGIRANCVSPGHIGPTELSMEGGASEEFFENLAVGIPLGRVGRLEEVANLYAFLASDNAEVINGASILIDGGQLAVQAGE